VCMLTKFRLFAYGSVSWCSVLLLWWQMGWCISKISLIRSVFNQILHHITLYSEYWDTNVAWFCSLVILNIGHWILYVLIKLRICSVISLKILFSMHLNLLLLSEKGGFSRAKGRRRTKFNRNWTSDNVDCLILFSLLLHFNVFSVIVATAGGFFKLVSLSTSYWSLHFCTAVPEKNIHV
jgi:hypothetical protein